APGSCLLRCESRPANSLAPLHLIHSSWQSSGLVRIVSHTNFTSSRTAFSKLCAQQCERYRYSVTVSRSAASPKKMSRSRASSFRDRKNRSRWALLPAIDPAGEAAQSSCHGCKTKVMLWLTAKVLRHNTGSTSLGLDLKQAKSPRYFRKQVGA